MIWVAVKAAQALSRAEREILIGVAMLGVALIARYITGQTLIVDGGQTLPESGP